jgi:hypothetical protein
MNKSNRFKTKSQTYKPTYRGYSDKKPTKIVIDSSKKEEKRKEEEKQVQNTIKEIKKDELSLQEEKKINKDKIIHENNLRVIEMLQADLDITEKDNELLLKEMELLKEQKKELLEKYEKIRDDLENEKTELEQLKDINDEKNREYLQLMHLRHQNIMNNHNSNSNDSNRNNSNERHRGNADGLTLGDVMDGLLLGYSRMRGENNGGDDQGLNLPFIIFHGNDSNDDGPPMSYSQIESLPSSNYPRNNNNNEKCTICGFEFFFNDLVTKLVKCNHTFHKTCLANRLSARQGSKCPICKISII